MPEEYKSFVNDAHSLRVSVPISHALAVSKVSVKSPVVGFTLTLKAEPCHQFKSISSSVSDNKTSLTHAGTVHDTYDIKHVTE